VLLMKLAQSLEVTMHENQTTRRCNHFPGQTRCDWCDLGKPWTPCDVCGERPKMGATFLVCEPCWAIIHKDEMPAMPWEM
jgi:hypothetical protein